MKRIMLPYPKMGYKYLYLNNIYSTVNHISPEIDEI